MSHVLSNRAEGFVMSSLCSELMREGHFLIGCFSNAAFSSKYVWRRELSGRVIRLEPCRDLGSSEWCEVWGAAGLGKDETRVIAFIADSEPNGPGRGFHLLKYRGGTLLTSAKVLGTRKIDALFGVSSSRLKDVNGCAVFSRDASRFAIFFNAGPLISARGIVFELKGSRVVNQRTLVRLTHPSVKASASIPFIGDSWSLAGWALANRNEQAILIALLDKPKRASNVVLTVLELSADEGLTVRKAYLRSDRLASIMSAGDWISGSMFVRSDDCSGACPVVLGVSVLPPSGFDSDVVLMEFSIKGLKVEVTSAVLLEDALGRGADSERGAMVSRYVDKWLSGMAVDVSSAVVLPKSKLFTSFLLSQAFAAFSSRYERGGVIVGGSAKVNLLSERSTS